MNYGPNQRDRPYDTSEPDGLGAVLSRLFAARGYGRVQADRQLHKIWKDVAGESLCSLTRVLSYRNGTLQIAVANSALMSELASFRKQELLEQIQSQYPSLKLRDIKFKLRSDLF